MKTELEHLALHGKESEKAIKTKSILKIKEKILDMYPDYERKPLWSLHTILKVRDPCN